VTFTGTVDSVGATIGMGFDNSGTVEVQAGALSVGSGYTQTSTGSLYELIGGLEPGTQYGQTIVTGVVNLDGSLHVALINGFVPHLNDQFLIIDNKGSSPVRMAGRGPVGVMPFSRPAVTQSPQRRSVNQPRAARPGHGVQARSPRFPGAQRGHSGFRRSDNRTARRASCARGRAGRVGPDLCSQHFHLLHHLQLLHLLRCLRLGRPGSSRAATRRHCAFH
jgi:hypothetical protein